MSLKHDLEFIHPWLYLLFLLLVIAIMVGIGMLRNHLVYGDATCLFKECIVVKGGI